MAVEVGALRALLSLDSAAFERGAKRAQASMSNLQRSLSKASENMGRLGRQLTTRFTAPLVGGLGLAARAVQNQAAEVSRLSAIANASTDSFQRMAAGAKTVGIEQEKLSDILKDTNDRVGDFLATGGGPMADFFENIAPKVGVTVDQFKELSGPEALQLYVSSLERAGVSQQEMTFYMEALASDATALVPLLRNNGEEMQRLGDNAARLGSIMDRDTIDALMRSRVAVSDATKAFTGLANHLIASLAPTIASLSERLVQVTQWFAGLSPEIKTTIAAVAGLAAALGPALIALGLMATAIGVLFAPITLTVVAISGLVSGIAWLVTNWDALSERLPILQSGFDALSDSLLGRVVGGVFGTVQAFSDLVKATGGVGPALAALGAAFVEWGDKTQARVAAVGETAKAMWRLFVSQALSGAADARDAVIEFANRAVGAVRGSVAAAGEIWNTFPAIVGDAVMQAAASVVDGIEAMINKAIAGLNLGVQKINSVRQALGADPIALIEEIDLPDVVSKYEGAAKSAGEAAQTAFNRAYSQNTFQRSGRDVLRGSAAEAALAGAEAAIVAAEFRKIANGPYQSIVKIVKALEDAGKTGAAIQPDLSGVSSAISGIAGAAHEAAGALAGSSGSRSGESIAAAMGKVADENPFEMMAKSLSDMAMNARSFGDFMSQALNRAGQSLLRSGLNNLFSAGLSGLSSLFGGGGGIASSIFDSFAGAFDKGGMIPAGSFGIAGERGPEIITGPANVTSRVDTARMMGGAMQPQLMAIDLIVTFDESGNPVARAQAAGRQSGQEAAINVIQRREEQQRRSFG